MATSEETSRGGRPPIPATVKAAFLSAMANTPAGSKPFAAALAACNVKKSTVYNWRKDSSFEVEFQLALRAHAGEISDVIFEEAVVGTPIFSDDGKVVGYRRNTMLLKALGESIGLLPSSRPAVAVAVGVNAGTEPARPSQLTEEHRQRIADLLHGRARPALEGTATEVLPDDGSDLV